MKSPKNKLLIVLSWLLALLLIINPRLLSAQGANFNVNLPTDFSLQIVANNLTQPVDFEFLTDGSLLVAQRNGIFKVSGPNQPASAINLPLNLTTAMTLPSVNTGQERGVTKMILDPGFSSNGYFYVYYTNDAVDRGRVSRFTFDFGTRTADPASEFIVFEDDSGFPGCCHYGGGLGFMEDGTLLIAIGDKFEAARAQDYSDPSGKLHRVDPSLPWYNGSLAGNNVPITNPLYEASGSDNLNSSGFLMSIVAVGLRNPFTGFNDRSGASWKLYLGEVGGNNHSKAWEDLHLAELSMFTGSNVIDYGWPDCGDGANNNTSGGDPNGRDQTTGECTDPNATDPIFSYPHQGGQAIMIGYRNTGGQFPAEYNDKFFYCDYVDDYIKSVSMDANGLVENYPTGNPIGTDPGDPQDFAQETSSGAGGESWQLVACKQGPDGSMYWSSLQRNSNNGYIGRIFYAGGFAPMLSNFSATPTSGPSPLNVDFSFDLTDADSDPNDVTYTLNFGDGNSATGTLASLPATISHTYINNGIYQAVVSVEDETFSIQSNIITITVGAPPTATISMPLQGDLFVANQTINYSGTDNDPDGSIVSREWFIEINNQGTLQPRFEGTGPSGSFTTAASAQNHVDFSFEKWYRITYRVTDNDGLIGEDFIQIFPDEVNTTLDANVAGVVLLLDGEPYATPYTFDDVINFEHEISAPAEVCINGTSYVFDSWSDGGARTHLINIPNTDMTFTANYLSNGECAGPPLSDDLVMWVEGDNGLSASGWLDQADDVNPSANTSHDLMAVGSPTIDPNNAEINGHASVQFNGSNSYMTEVSTASDLPAGNANRTIFMVSKYGNGGQWGGFVYGTSSSNNAFGLVKSGTACTPDNPGAGYLAVEAWGCGNNVYSDGDDTDGLLATNVWSTQSVVLNNGNTVLYVNGTAVGSGNNSFNTSGTNIRLARQISDGSFMDMCVAEIIVYDRALTELERQEVELYLQTKYFGTTNNNPPVLASIGNQSVDIGQVLNVPLAATDADNDDLDFSYTSVPDASGFTTLTDNNDGTGSLEFSPLSGAEGTYTITVLVSDGEASDQETFTLTVGQVSASCNSPVTTGLVLCLESDQGVTETANTVSAWADNSGQGNDLTANGDPTIGVATTPTGQPAIVLDGTLDWLERTATLSGLPSGAGERTAFFVVKYTATAAFAGLSYGTGAANQAFGLTTNGTNGFLTLQGWGGGNDVVSSEPGVGAGWLVQSAVLQPNGDYVHYKDGSSISTGNRTFGTVLSRLVIGEEISGGGNGEELEVAAALIFDRALNETERQQVEEYLQQKYIETVAGNTPPDLDPIGNQTVEEGQNLLVNLTAADVDMDAITLSYSSVPDASGFTTFTDNTDGSGSLEFNPLSGDAGTYTITVTADDGLDTDQEVFTLTVTETTPTSCNSPVTTGLVLCLESDQGVTETANTVSAWADNSGQGNDLTANGDPTIGVATTPTGQPAIVLDGTLDWLERTATLSGLPSGAGERTAFFVVKYTATAAFAGLSYGTGAANQAFGLTTNGTNGFLTLQGWGGGNDVVSSEPGVGAGWLVQSAVLQPNGDYVHYKDGSSISTGNRTFGTVLSRLVIGEEISGGGNGEELEVAAALIFDRALNETERQQVEEYLQQKYIETVAGNTPPDLDPIGNQTVEEGQNLLVNLTAADVDMDAITLSYSSVPDVSGFTTFTDNTDGSGSLEFNPLSGDAGTYTITVTADDGLDTDQEVFTLTVTETTPSGDCNLITSGLVVRYESNVGITASGSSVTAWADQGGLGNDLTSVGEPQLVTSTGAAGELPAGKSYVQFDGIDDYLTRSGFTGLSTGNADRTMFMVARYREANFGGAVYGNDQSNSAFGLVLTDDCTAFAPDGNLAIEIWDCPNNVYGNVSGLNAGWLVQSAVADQQSIDLYWNGSPTPIGSEPASTFNTAADGILLGGAMDAPTTDRKTDMDIAAVLIYDRALSAAERLQVENYLLEQYLNVGNCGDNASLAGSTGINTMCAGLNMEIELYDPGTTNLVQSATVILDANGDFIMTGIPVGTYDVLVHPERHLAKKIAEVAFSESGSTPVNFGDFLAGDANGDNVVTILDFSALSGAFGSEVGDAEFDDRVDFNCDGFITILDFSALAGQFGNSGETPGN